MEWPEVAAPWQLPASRIRVRGVLIWHELFRAGRHSSGRNQPDATNQLDTIYERQA